MRNNFLFNLHRNRVLKRKREMETKHEDIRTRVHRTAAGPGGSVWTESANETRGSGPNDGKQKFILQKYKMPSSR